MISKQAIGAVAVSNVHRGHVALPKKLVTNSDSSYADRKIERGMSELRQNLILCKSKEMYYPQRLNKKKKSIPSYRTEGAETFLILKIDLKK
jgi:hypothetical protein